MRVIPNILLSVCFVAIPALAQSSAGRDIKEAGSAVKTMFVKTGTATGKVTATGARKTAHVVKKGTLKVVGGTGSMIEKGGAKMKEAGK